MFACFFNKTLRYTSFVKALADYELHVLFKYSRKEAVLRRSKYYIRKLKQKDCIAAYKAMENANKVHYAVKAEMGSRANLIAQPTNRLNEETL